MKQGQDFPKVNARRWIICLFGMIALPVICALRAIDLNRAADPGSNLADNCAWGGVLVGTIVVWMLPARISMRLWTTILYAPTTLMLEFLIGDRYECLRYHYCR